jgi:uncharacterized membrane protein
MSWQHYALLSAVMMAAADLSVKAASTRISSSLGLVFYGGTAFAVGLLWTGWQYYRGHSFLVETHGVGASMATGFSFSLVTIGLFWAFQAGAPVSLVSPTVRTTGLLLASAAGLLLLREPLTGRYLVGMILAMTGIYLVVTR